MLNIEVQRYGEYAITTIFSLIIICIFHRLSIVSTGADVVIFTIFSLITIIFSIFSYIIIIFTILFSSTIILIFHRLSIVSTGTCHYFHNIQLHYNHFQHNQLHHHFYSIFSSTIIRIFHWLSIVLTGADVVRPQETDWAEDSRSRSSAYLVAMILHTRIVHALVHTRMGHTLVQC